MRMLMERGRRFHPMLESRGYRAAKMVLTHG